MKPKARVVLVVAVVGLAATATAAAGVFDATSPRYWRRFEQLTLFWAAETMPKTEALRKTRHTTTLMAMRVLPRDLSEAEIERSATLFAEIGDSSSAATLELGLANADYAKGDSASARAHAERSFRTMRSAAAATALVIIERPDSSARKAWMNELRTLDPDHDLIVADDCDARLTTLEVDPPEICAAKEWVSRAAWDGRREDLRIAAAIDSLPRHAQHEIAESEQRIASATAEMEQLASEYRVTAPQLAGLGWKAVGEVVVDMLPIPKANDTAGQFIAREGFCHYFKWLCGIGAVGSALARMDERKTAIERRLAMIDTAYRADQWSINIGRAHVSYWRSSAPLDELVQQRSALLGALHEKIRNGAVARYHEPGMPVDVAVDQVIAPRRSASAS